MVLSEGACFRDGAIYNHPKLPLANQPWLDCVSLVSLDINLVHVVLQETTTRVALLLLPLLPLLPVAMLSVGVLEAMVVTTTAMLPMEEAATAATSVEMVALL